MNGPPKRVYRADWIGNHYCEGANIWSGPSSTYLLATPEDLAAAPEVQALIRGAEARGVERAAAVAKAYCDKRFTGSMPINPPPPALFTWDEGNKLAATIRAEAAAIRAEAMTDLITAEAVKALQELREFLGGSGPMDGLWFSDTHPERKGAFWWRKELSRIDAAISELAQAPADAKAAVAVVVEKVVEMDQHVGGRSGDTEFYYVDGPIARKARALIPEDAIAEVARLRADVTGWASNATEAWRLMRDAEAERDRLAAELAAANARIRQLESRDGINLITAEAERDAALAQTSTEPNL